jgi:hypothetical protein
VAVHVNAVPGDLAASRVPDPEAASGTLFQQAQKAKRDAKRLLSEGCVEDAAAQLRRSSAQLRAQLDGLPPMFATELGHEADLAGHPRRGAGTGPAASLERVVLQYVGEQR